MKNPDLFEPPDNPDMIEVLSVIRVAKHIGVAPWELIRQPVYWYEMGELAVRIENTQYEGVKKAAMKAGK